MSLHIAFELVVLEQQTFFGGIIINYIVQFFKFDTFIVPKVLVFLYFALTALIVLTFGIASLAALFNEEFLTFLGMLILIPISVFVLRIYFELILLAFKIYERLAGIENSLKHGRDTRYNEDSNRPLY